MGAGIGNELVSGPLVHAFCAHDGWSFCLEYVSTCVHVTLPVNMMCLNQATAPPVNASSMLLRHESQDSSLSPGRSVLASALMLLHW